MSYANRPPRTPLLQGYRIIREGEQTITVASQLTNGNKIEKANSKRKGHKKGVKKVKDKPNQLSQL